MTRLTMVVEFPLAPSPQREAEIRGEVATVRATFEAMGGKVVKADLSRHTKEVE